MRMCDEKHPFRFYLLGWLTLCCHMTSIHGINMGLVKLPKDHLKSVLAQSQSI